MAQSFNYSSLLGRIKERGFTQETLAFEAHISPSMLNRKLNGIFPFKQTDIQNIVDVLEIPATEIGRYFFTVSVEKTQQ